MLDKLFEIHQRIINDEETNLKRYLYNSVHWNQRLIVIAGARGVGKTTMILQHVKETYGESKEALYVTADSVLVNQMGIFNIAHEFEKMGGKLLVIDEVHKYKNWNQEVKNIYDSFPSLKTVISGSSALNIIKGQYDLSRRAVLYKLKTLSFREFINFKVGKNILEPYSLDSLLTTGQETSAKVLKKVEEEQLRVLPLFNKYLKIGCYPYFLEGEEDYLNKLQNSLSKVMFEDIPAVYQFDLGAVNKLQKILYLISTSVPLTPNISSMSSDLGINKSTLYSYLESLKQSGLINFLISGQKGARMARKPEKIYLENPNLFYAIEESEHLVSNIGAVRETFACNQLSFSHRVVASKDLDFLVDNKYNIEVGGKNKGIKKLASDAGDFVLKDGIEYGQGNIIPIWALGFLY